MSAVTAANAQPASLFDKLDNDVLSLVMANVPFMYHRALRLTCSRWKQVVEASSFAQLRLTTGLAEDVLVVAGGYMGQCCVYDNCSAMMQVGDRARFFELPRLPRAFLAPGCGDWPPDGGVNEACAAAVNGTVHVFGGESQGDPGWATDTVLRLCVATGAWDILPRLPQPRQGACCGTIGDKIVIAGGLVAERGTEYHTDYYVEAWNSDVTDSVLLFDPATSTFTEAAPMPYKCVSNAYGVIGDKLFVFGGCGEYDWEEDGDRIEIDTIAVYDKTADSWSVRKPVSGPAGGYLRGGRVGVGFEGKLYLVGGRTTAVDIYDPDKNSWSSGPPLPLYDYSDPEAPKLIDYDNDGPDLRHHDRFVVRYGPTVSVFNGSIVVVAGGARGSVVLKNGEWRLGPHLPGELFETGSTIPYASAAVARV